MYLTCRTDSCQFALLCPVTFATLYHSHVYAHVGIFLVPSYRYTVNQQVASCTIQYAMRLDITVNKKSSLSYYRKWRCLVRPRSRSLSFSLHTLFAFVSSLSPHFVRLRLLRPRFPLLSHHPHFVRTLRSPMHSAATPTPQSASRSTACGPHRAIPKFPASSVSSTLASTNSCSALAIVPRNGQTPPTPMAVSGQLGRDNHSPCSRASNRHSTSGLGRPLSTRPSW